MHRKVFFGLEHFPKWSYEFVGVPLEFSSARVKTVGRGSGKTLTFFTGPYLSGQNREKSFCLIKIQTNFHK